jgi:hypothetical protein
MKCCNDGTESALECTVEPSDAESCSHTREASTLNWRAAVARAPSHFFHISATVPSRLSRSITKRETT